MGGVFPRGVHVPSSLEYGGEFSGAEPPPTPPLQQVLAIGVLLAVFMLLPGITAPFGATILGAVSISQIRHSAGRLYGLGLALFNALLFPLLLLDWVIIMLPASVIWFFLNVKTAGGTPPTLPADSIKVGVLLFFVFMIALALRIDYLIVRWAWREANRPVGAHLPERATGLCQCFAARRRTTS